MLLHQLPHRRGELGALPGAPQFHNADGGTPYALYRKDRVRFTQEQTCYARTG